jgi:hypothetical protein
VSEPVRRLDGHAQNLATSPDLVRRSSVPIEPSGSQNGSRFAILMLWSIGPGRACRRIRDGRTAADLAQCLLTGQGHRRRVAFTLLLPQLCLTAALSGGLARRSIRPDGCRLSSTVHRRRLICGPVVKQIDKQPKVPRPTRYERDRPREPSIRSVQYRL